MTTAPGKVDFFIVGAPKCGTTSMDYYLSQHPEIFIAPTKECHHFATDLLPEGHPMTDPARYAELFEGRRDEKICGESSVFYLLSRDAAQRIHDYNPAAKILIMLRNPVDVLASHHSQIVYEGYEPIEDLETALEKEDERRRDLSPFAKKMRIPQVLLYRDVVRFSEQVARFIDRFGRDQVHVVFFEDLKQDTPGMYRQVVEFLGADPAFEPRYGIVNRNKKVRSPAVRWFLRRTPSWVSASGRVFMSSDKREQLRNRINRWNTQFVPRDPMKPEYRRRLEAEFRGDIIALGSLLDRDLHAWCQD